MLHREYRVMRHKCHRLGRFMRVAYIRNARSTCETDITQGVGEMARGSLVNGVSNNPDNIARCLPCYKVTLCVCGKMRHEGCGTHLIPRVKFLRPNVPEISILILKYSHHQIFVFLLFFLSSNMHSIAFKISLLIFLHIILFTIIQ